MKPYIDYTTSVPQDYNILENIGDDTKIWRWTQICNGVKIGHNCMIGNHCYVGPNVVIGNNVRIQNGCYIPEGVTIGNNVFIGPHVVFTNDKYPPQDRELWGKVIVEDGVVIGANSTILPGITLHGKCVVGAGSVVTKDIEEGQLWCGNPARILL